MTEEKIQGQTDQAITAGQTAAAPQPARRWLLKSTVAIPVIMTLHSGAALARTSNLVSEVEPRENAFKVQPDPLAPEGYVCARPSTDPDIEQPVGDGRYDLGESPVIDYVENLDDCIAPDGILLSSHAYGSLMGIEMP